ENGCLVFKAVRQKPREVMTISFDRIYLLFAQSLVDKGEFLLYASEEDMQKAILLQPSLIEEGLRPITYEKKIEPGFIDVYGVDKNGKMVVIEIKRKTAGKEAALQLAKYLESLKTTTTQEIRGILVAPQISKGVQKLLLTLGMEFKPLDPKKCIENLRKTKTRKIEDFF
ncbi:MAG: endonuclease NucS, partial [Candidatus Bathyarchaeia archaeon]